MPDFSDATLVKVVAPANGTNDLVLSDPASQGPYRTDVQAVADGSLSNGDLVHYEAWRTTTTGDAAFERGYGAYTASTRTVARTAGNVLDGSDGPGVLVDFGLSGQMDVFFLEPLDGSKVPDADVFCDNIGAARLNAQNTFTQSLTVDKGATQGAISAQSTKTSGVVGLYNFNGKDSGGALEVYARIIGNADDGTAGSEDGSLLFQTDVAGTLTTVAQISGGALKDGSGVPYDHFPSGQELTTWTTPPTGWVRQNEANSSLVRLATSGDTIGGSAGSSNIFSGSWQTTAHNLTISEMPSHSHPPGGSSTAFQTVAGSGTQQYSIVSGSSSVNADPATGTTGSGAAHAHAITTPYYRIACRMQKS